MRYLLGLMAGLCVAISAPMIASQSPAESQPAAVDAQYRVGPSDELKINVFDEPALSGTFRVDADGSIPYSLVGRVVVAAKTVREIEQLLTQRLLDGYVRQPRVTVEVAQFRSRKVFIMGEVRTPGQYALDGDVTLLEVLALAGALTESAGEHISVRRSREPAEALGASLPEDPETVEVLRVSLADLQAGRLASNLVLQDGDTIIVPAAPRVFVTGHVRNPGAVVLRGRLTVQQAIALAGGFTERGSNRGIKIRREVSSAFVEIDVALTDFVQANDTIIVRQRRI
jgi:polysaccharide export outer membrane protein